jgi:hypothetical protein
MIRLLGQSDNGRRAAGQTYLNGCRHVARAAATHIRPDDFRRTSSTLVRQMLMLKNTV